MFGSGDHGRGSQVLRGKPVRVRRCPATVARSTTNVA